MIGKASSVKGSVAGMDYLNAEGKGYELDRNKILGETSKEIMQDFRMQQLDNSTCKNKMFTAVISPDASDGKKLTDFELKEIGKEFMQGLGVDTDRQAYIMIVHRETEHKHIHLYVNRIQENGKAIDDSFIGKKASEVAHRIAKSRGLVSAKEIMIERINLTKELDKNLKSEIYSKHQAVMISNPKGFDNYIKQMNLKGLEVKPTINMQGEIQGFRVRDLKTDKDFKMSEVHRSMSTGNLVKNGLINDLDYKLDTSLNRSKTKQISNNPNTKKIVYGLQKAVKNEVNQVKDIGAFQLKSAGKFLLKTVIIEPPKMTKEEYKKELEIQKDMTDAVESYYIISANEENNSQLLINEEKNLEVKNTHEEYQREEQQKEEQQEEERNNLRDLEI